jgi:hypothetical protein
MTNPAPTISDFEDFTKLALTSAELDDLIGDGGQCVFSWTTSAGYPAGVVMAYLFRDGRFWMNCARHRKRIAALRARPQCAIVLTTGEKIASFRGRAVIHSPDEAGWKEVKSWFYAALAGTDKNPDNDMARSFETFLDGPNQVIIETEPTLVVSFNFGKFAATTQAAIAALTVPAVTRK